LRFGYSSTQEYPQPSKFTKQEKATKKEEIRSILRSNPFHDPFYHRYLQNEMGNSQFRTNFSDEWWNVKTSEFRRGDENRP